MKIIDMFNEDNTVEQMLIEAATQSGWQYVKSQDIPRSSDSVLVESWLLEALVRLNPITRQQAEQVIYKLRAAITCGGNYDELVTANDRFRTLLFRDIPKIIKFKATNSLRVSCLFCIFKHSPQKTV